MASCAFIATCPRQWSIFPRSPFCFLDSRISTIMGLFALNRSGGAPADIGKGRLCCRPEDENIPACRSLSARRSFDSRCGTSSMCCREPFRGAQETIEISAL